MKFQKNDLLEAVEKSLKNAEELIEEAKLLKSHKKFARSYTLYQLSIEEIGKMSLTFNFLMYDDIEDDLQCKAFLKNFTHHQTKTKISIGLDLIFALNSDASNFNKEVVKNFLNKSSKENINISNNLKNYSLYTSLIENKFYSPSEIITEDKVNDIEFWANLRLEIANSFFAPAIKNFDKLYETRKDFNKQEAVEEGIKVLGKILAFN